MIDKWSIHRLVDRGVDRLTNWRINIFIDTISVHQLICFDLLSDRVTDGLSDRPIDWLTEQCVDWPFHWLRSCGWSFSFVIPLISEITKERRNKITSNLFTMRGKRSPFTNSGLLSHKLQSLCAFLSILCVLFLISNPKTEPLDNPLYDR